jgi:hypothetical protein
MTVDAIVRSLHDPDEIGYEEYKLIHQQIMATLATLPEGTAALDAAIEVCNMFIDWASAAKEVLVPLRAELEAGSSPKQ